MYRERIDSSYLTKQRLFVSEEAVNAGHIHACSRGARLLSGVTCVAHLKTADYCILPSVHVSAPRPSLFNSLAAVSGALFGWLPRHAYSNQLQSHISRRFC